MKFSAVFFDLDGTLIDSKLDFDAMRRDLNFPKGVPILEEIEKLTDKVEIEKSMEIVHQHELIGAQNSKLIEGVSEVLAYLHENDIPTGILTRNSRVCTELMLSKHKLDFDQVLTREDCAPKPSPEGLLILARHFQVEPRDCLYVGDFHFDIITAHNANMQSALIQSPKTKTFENEATYLFKTYQNFIPSILLS